MPVGDVALDAARDDHEDQYQDVDDSEDLVYHG